MTSKQFTSIRDAGNILQERATAMTNCYTDLQFYGLTGNKENVLEYSLECDIADYLFKHWRVKP